MKVLSHVSRELIAEKINFSHKKKKKLLTSLFLITVIINLNFLPQLFQSQDLLHNVP